MGEIEILRKRETDFEFEAFNELGIRCDHEYRIEEMLEAWNLMWLCWHMSLELILNSP